MVTTLRERLWTIGEIDPTSCGEVRLAWSDLRAPSEKEKIANMQAMADVAQKTQAAYGTPAIEQHEIRAVGELEPLPENELPPPVPPGDPLSDDPTANPDAGNTPLQGRSDTVRQAS